MDDVAWLAACNPQPCAHWGQCCVSLPGALLRCWRRHHTHLLFNSWAPSCPPPAPLLQAARCAWTVGWRWRPCPAGTACAWSARSTWPAQRTAAAARGRRCARCAAASWQASGSCRGSPLLHLPWLHGSTPWCADTRHASVSSSLTNPTNFPLLPFYLMHMTLLCLFDINPPAPINPC